MWVLSYTIAVVLVLTGPSLAGLAGSRDMPGTGTFIYLQSSDSDSVI
jgi:hypothetical protein